MTLASCAMAMMLTVSGCYAGGRNVVKPSKNYVTEKVSISDIEAIKSSSSVDVVYTQASGTPYADTPKSMRPTTSFRSLRWNKTGRLCG